jgi:hypothetical protein
MSIRMMVCGALLVGSTLFATACGPAAEAQDTATTQEQQAEGQFCGGIAAFPCPEGYTCVDDPNDDCDPNQGGADCGGICRKAPREAQNHECPNGSGVYYVSRDPNQCAAILYTCPEGYSPFFSDCGCGCQQDPRAACNYNDPNRTWVSQDPDQCAVIRFYCDEGQPFFDDCGCGCETTP